MPEYLDIILISIGGLLIVASVVVNILSTTRLSRLSESLNRLEEHVEYQTVENKPKKEGADSAFDSSILPGSDLSDTDSRGTRYRPPGSRTGAPKKEESRPEGSSTRILIRKSGIKVPETVAPAPELEMSPEPVPVEAPIPEPAAETASAKKFEAMPIRPGEVFSSTAEIPADALAEIPAPKSAVPEKAAPLAVVPPSPAEAPSRRRGTEEEELLKSYLGDSSARYFDANPSDPAEAGEGAEAEEDVMEVIQDTGVYPAVVAAAPDYNPFDAALQRVNLAPVRAALPQVPGGGRLTLDFCDVLFLVDEEQADLLRLSAETEQRGVTLALRNVTPGLQAELSAKLPALTYL